MKLLCVVPSYWPAYKFGGPIYSVHLVNKSLAKKGIDVTVYTTNVGLNEKVTVNKEINIDRVKVIYFSFIKFFEFLSATGWQFSMSMNRAIQKNLKKFDIVNMTSIWNYPISMTACYCRKYKKPYVISPRGMLYSYTLNKKWFRKKLYYSLIAKRDLKNASAIHYTTEKEMEDCHIPLGFKNEAFVIPNGINLIKCINTSEKDGLISAYPYIKNKKVILSLGRIHQIKGLEILIRAYANLKRERDDIHLIIAGDGNEQYIQTLKKQITHYGLIFIDSKLHEKHKSRYHDIDVTFTGMLTGENKWDVFKGSNIFILPSYSESFGLVAIEAMSCGLPVIITNKVGIYKEVKNNNAGIVADVDDVSIYKSFKLLFENPLLVKVISTNGRHLVEKYYDIDKVAVQMIKMFEGVLLKNGVG